MTSGMLEVERRPNGVAWVTLDRPKVHNAFDDRLVAELTAALQDIAQDSSVRAVVLTGAGKSFSAGADLNWMRRMAGYSKEENLADAKALARLLTTLDELPKPTVARVNGAALGGGVGLVACADVAIASDEAAFGTTEVRLGLIPSVIGPYVLRAVGHRTALRLMLTGERITAVEAARLGLVHQAVHADDLDHAVEHVLADLLKGGPDALAAVKALLGDVAGRPLTPEITDLTAERIARVRASAEGQEGVAAFLEKRKPRWLG